MFLLQAKKPTPPPFSEVHKPVWDTDQWSGIGLAVSSLKIRIFDFRMLTGLITWQLEK